MNRHSVLRKFGNARFVSVIAVLLILLLVFWGHILGTSYTNKDFPLSEKWSLRLGGNIQHLSLVDNQILLVMTRTKLFALDGTSGDIFWEHDLHWQTMTKPALAQNGLVFLTDEQGISALDQSDGNILWQQPVSRAQNAQIVSVSDDVVAVGYPPYLNVHDVASGVLLWSEPVCRERVEPYIYGGNVYVPCYGVAAMDIGTGEIVWEIESPDRIWHAGYADGVMYSSPDRRAVIAFDLESHETLWRTPLDSKRMQEFKIVGEYLLLTDYEKFCVLQRTDGYIFWCADTGWKIQNPVLMGGVGYIFNGPQTVMYAFDATDGTKIGELVLAKFGFITIYRQLLVSSDELLFFAHGEKIFAFGE